MVSTIAGQPLTNGYADGTGTNALFSGVQGVVLGKDGESLCHGLGEQRDFERSRLRVLSSRLRAIRAFRLAGRRGHKRVVRNPVGIATDNDGNLYVADAGNNAIRKITSDGLASTLANQPPIADWQDGNGQNAWFNNPGGVALDADGNIFVADTGNSCIRKITPAGDVTTTAGTSSPRSCRGAVGRCRFMQPAAIAFYRGHLALADVETSLFAMVV